VKALLKRVAFGDEPGVRRIHVGLLRGLNFTIDPRDKSQRLLGLEEKEIIGHVREAARHARTAIDVGSHDGWYATFFASRPSIAKVIACDPNPKALDLLRENLAVNNLSGRVDVQQVMVGGSKKPGFRQLDELLDGQSPPYAIKIDVDGGELDVLKSGAQALGRDCRLVVETHSEGLERDCVSFLQQLGYHTTIVPNAWYRAFVPELRPTAHNRWFVARPGRAPQAKERQ
jgi:predicted RNA methylase